MIVWNNLFQLEVDIDLRVEDAFSLSSSRHVCKLMVMVGNQMGTSSLSKPNYASVYFIGLRRFRNFC